MPETATVLSNPLSHPCHAPVDPHGIQSSVVCLHCFLTDRERTGQPFAPDAQVAGLARPMRADRELTSREVGHRWRMLTHLRRYKSR